MLEQNARRVQVNTPFGTNVVVFRRLRFQEALGQSFFGEVYLISEHDDLDFADIVGHNITIRVEHDKGERYFNGYVIDFCLFGTREGQYLYKAAFTSWFSLLKKNLNTRIFQDGDAAVDRVLKAVFTEFSGNNHYDDSKLKRKPQQRDYVVQYEESDFEFASRIMEREGIYYYFNHFDGFHQMIVVDDVASLPMALEDGRPLHYRQHDSTSAEDPHIYRWRPTMRLNPTKVVLSDFNFETARARLLTQTQMIQRTHGLAEFERYERVGGYRNKDDGNTLARLRAEEAQSNTRTAEGKATDMAVEVGRRFDLVVDAPEMQHAEGEYLITSCRFEITDTDYKSEELTMPKRRASSGHDRDDFTDPVVDAPFIVDFEVQPADTPFRTPRVHMERRVSGPQTAIVVASGNDEIQTDKFGRVRVKFHWDRSPSSSSCWVRVSQHSAGNGWGAFSLPRKDQEVIVDFIEGDPERPIITGRVFNSVSTPPYDPELNKTRTVFRTNSSVGGEGHNELTFEDKKGEEFVYIHAQKNLHQRVRNSQLRTIAGNNHAHVYGSEYREVHKELHETVEQDAFHTINDTIHFRVGSDFLIKADNAIVGIADNEISLEGKSAVSIGSNSEISLNVGSSFIKIGPSSIHITSPSVLVNSGGSPGNLNLTEAEPAKKPYHSRNSTPGLLSPPSTARVEQLTPQQLDSHPVSQAMRAAHMSAAYFCEDCAR